MKVPTTVITGYLGAGKTTLLRRIAKASRMRIAILMNEFGEIAIDSKVVKGENISMIELSGGCVCCSLSGEFSAAVSEMLETIRPEWIVVETTGAAEPAALAYDIAQSIPGVKLDSIVTVVDADSMERFPSLGHTGREQIELADIIILNKTDLVSAQSLETTRDALKAMNGRAIVLESERCKIDTALLFGISRESVAKKHKAHKIDIGYFDYASDGAIRHDKLLALLAGMPEGIFRAKGFVKTDKGCFLMNYVAGRHELEETGCARTELVFIGKGAISQRERIRSALDSIRI